MNMHINAVRWNFIAKICKRWQIECAVVGLDTSLVQLQSDTSTSRCELLLSFPQESRTVHHRRPSHQMNPLRSNTRHISHIITTPFTLGMHGSIPQVQWIIYHIFRQIHTRAPWILRTMDGKVLMNFNFLIHFSRISETHIGDIFNEMGGLLSCN